MLWFDNISLHSISNTVYLYELIRTVWRICLLKYAIFASLNTRCRNNVIDFKLYAIFSRQKNINAFHVNKK